jgi:hypothetical protein
VLNLYRSHLPLASHKVLLMSTRSLLDASLRGTPASQGQGSQWCYSLEIHCIAISVLLVIPNGNLIRCNLIAAFANLDKLYGHQWSTTTSCKPNQLCRQQGDVLHSCCKDLRITQEKEHQYQYKDIVNARRRTIYVTSPRKLWCQKLVR